MERQIKFRGYNLKNKKWIYGYYFVNRGKHFIADDGIAAPGATWEDFEVDAESVGQYVCTVKGADLYEGDFVIQKWACGYDVEYLVSYDNKRHFWYLLCVDEEFKLILPRSYIIEDEDIVSEGDNSTTIKYKVIGNEYEKKIKGNG